MKTNKRLISLLLTLALVLSCVPGIALLAGAEEIAKPQGISIVQDFDEYYPITRDENGVAIANWTNAVLEALPEGEWENPAKHVDPSTPGYYSIPGTVDGVATSVTVEVREKVNLFKMGNMEDTIANIKKELYFRGTASVVNNPVYAGKSAVKVDISAALSTVQVVHNSVGSGQADLAAAINAHGAGTYYYGAWVMAGEGTDEVSVGMKLAVTDANGKVTYDHQMPWLKQGQFVKTWGTVELGTDNTSVAMYIQYSISKARLEAGDLMDGDSVYFDDIELIKIDIEKLETEPEAIAEITGDATPNAIAIIENYDTYVSNWKDALGLPATIAITGTDGKDATANISWNYDVLNLAKPGKYTLTGKVISEEYVNTSNLTIEQVVLVRAKTNMFINGSADDGKTGWTGGHTVTTVEYPAESGNNVFKVYSSKLVDGRQGFYQSADEQVAAAQRMQAYGHGQYKFSVKMMSAPYDAETPAIEGLAVLFTQRYYDAAGTKYADFSNGGKSIVLSTTEWTTISFTCNVDGNWQKLLSEFKISKSNGAAGAWYIDDIEMIPLRVELAPVEECEHAACEQTVVEPTCGKDGYTYNLCPACGHSF